MSLPTIAVPRSRQKKRDEQRERKTEERRREGGGRQKRILGFSSLILKLKEREETGRVSGWVILILNGLTLNDGLELNNGLISLI